MILYLYAVVDELADVSGLSGVAAEPLALLPLENHIVVGGWMAGAPPVEKHHLAAQDAVVRALHARAASVLPMRFGTSVASVDDAERAVRTMSTGLRERLARARGREQMTIRVLGGTDAAGAAGVAGAAGAAGASGARYLAERAAKATPPEIAPLLQALQLIQRATRVEAGRRSGVVATIYQLIDRGAGDSYRQTAERAAADLPALTIRITGPSPCYAFA